MKKWIIEIEMRAGERNPDVDLRKICDAFMDGINMKSFSIKTEL